jgi:hypothetical protein
VPICGAAQLGADRGIILSQQRSASFLVACGAKM